MRKYDVAYVANGPVNYYPTTPLQDMTLDEIKRKYIKTCAKANGDVSVCSRCKTPCPEGKRCIQLVANEIYNDPPIPLYGGKTLIERAREENIKRREEMENKTEIKETKKTGKDGRLYIDNWYEKASMTDDLIKWVMDAFGFSKTKAKAKVYQYRTRHPELTENKTEEIKEKTKNIKEEIKEEPFNFTYPVTEETVYPQEDNKIETKLESLMKLQEEHKKAMNEYLRLYEQAKTEYEKIKQKTDVLCNALDILNDI